MKANLKLTAAALFLGTMVSASAVAASAGNAGETPMSKKECAQKVACRDYGARCKDSKKCHDVKKHCIKNSMCCSGCGAPMVVVYEMDEFFAIPDHPGAKPETHKNHQHATAPAHKPGVRRSVVKPVMQKGKDGKPQQVGYVVLFVDEIEDAPHAKPAEKPEPVKK